MRTKYSIKFKLLTLIIVIVAMANLTVGIRSINISSKVISETVASNMKNQANTVARLVEDVISQEFKLLDGLAQIPIIGERDVSIKEKQDLLTNITKMDPKKYNNIGYCSVDGKALVGPRTMDFSQRDLYLNAKKNERYASEPSESSFQPGMWLMYYSVPVFRNGVFEGAVLSVVEGNDLDVIASGIDIGNGSGIHPLIVDRKTGQVIGIADREKMPDASDQEFGKIMQSVTQNAEGYYSYKDSVTNQDMLVAFCQIPDSTAQWSVICTVPAKLYLSGIDVIKYNSMGALVLSLLISIAVSSVLISIIIKPLRNVNKSMNEIASGSADLTKRIEKTTRDEVGQLVEGFNSFTEKMQTIVKDIQYSNDYLGEIGIELDSSTAETGVSIKEIIENIADVHNQIDVQSNSVHETAGAVNEIASNIESLERMIAKQSEGVSQASSEVQKMIHNIASVNESMDKMAVSFTELTTSAKEGTIIQNEVNTKIEEILNQSKTLQDANIAIASIAGQTNLLAMNAAIEAAHAGEAGKGFSVVADEIRKLSETSSAQSKTIGEHLSNIQTSIQNVVTACTKSSQAFESMAERIGMTDELVKIIKTVMEAQTEGSRQIDASLHAMNDSTEEVRIASQEMAYGNKAILEEVSVLQDATGVMKISMEKMRDKASKITETENTLSNISNKMRDSISDISNQINQFDV
ncbi:MAG: methyl-accepting chemotaxis protein [Treponema sp.]|nr:methyl-accepting chemotaxis protein [Treponema sp.]